MEDVALNKNYSKTADAPTDDAEIGSDSFGQDLTLSLLGSERSVLEQIEAALERIAGGSYGRCEECRGKIPTARLDAIPYAALCVKCASQQERG